VALSFDRAAETLLRHVIVRSRGRRVLFADSAARAALYSAFGQNGVMTRGEMRSKENLPSMPGDDFLTVQSNLVPLEQLGAAPSAEQGARSALMNLLFGGDVDAMIDERVKARLSVREGLGVEA